MDEKHAFLKSLFSGINDLKGYVWMGLLPLINLNLFTDNQALAIMV